MNLFSQLNVLIALNLIAIASVGVLLYKNNKKKIRVEYFDEVEMIDRFFWRKVRKRKMQQIFYNDLPIGSPTVMSESCATMADKTQITNLIKLTSQALALSNKFLK